MLKYLRERACISDGFREVFAQKKVKGEGGPARLDLFFLRGSSCFSLLAVGRADKMQYSKARMVKEQGGEMAP